MISHSDDKTFMQMKHSTPSEVRFADEAGPFKAPSAPSTPNTETATVTSVSTDDLYTALSEIFFSTLMASLTSKDAILK